MSNKLTGTLCLVALSGLSFLLASGCSESNAVPPSRGAAAEAAPANAAGSGDGRVGGESKSDTDTYLIEIKGSGAYKAGQEGVVEVTLLSKGDYKVNDKYPVKFKVADPAPEGVTFPKPLLKREDGTFDLKKGSFKVPFVAAKPGKAKIAGTLSFSVCSESNCLMEKKELEVAVDVK